MRLRFAQCFAALQLAEAGKFKDNALNKQAVDLHERFTDQRPNAAVAHNNYAVILYHLKQFEKSEKHYKAALEINPDYVKAHYNYAILLYDLERFEEAEGHYKAALKINPDDANAHYNYALLLCKLKRFEEAEKHYKTALKINPDFANAWAGLGCMYRDMKNYEDARKCYQRALEKGTLPDDGERVRKWLGELDNLPKPKPHGEDA